MKLDQKLSLLAFILVWDFKVLSAGKPGKQNAQKHVTKAESLYESIKEFESAMLQTQEDQRLQGGGKNIQQNSQAPNAAKPLDESDDHYSRYDSISPLTLNSSTSSQKIFLKSDKVNLKVPTQPFKQLENGYVQGPSPLKHRHNKKVIFETSENADTKSHDCSPEIVEINNGALRRHPQERRGPYTPVKRPKLRKPRGAKQLLDKSRVSCIFLSEHADFENIDRTFQQMITDTAFDQYFITNIKAEYQKPVAWLAKRYNLIIMDQTKETITLKRDKNSSFPLNRSPIEELIATDEAMRAWKHQYSREDTSEEIEMMGYQDKLLSTLDWIIETESAKHEPTSSTDLEPCDETDISPNLTVHERVAPEQSDDNEGIIPEISNAKTNCFNLNPRKHNKVSSDDDLDFDIGSYIGKAYKSELELFLRDSEDGQTKATEETTMYDPFSEECNLRPAQTYNVQLHSRDIDEDESQVSNSFELLQSTFAEHFFQHDSFALSQFAESMSGVSHDESLISGPFDLSHLPSDLEFTV